MTIHNLRETYNTISESYQSKKSEAWHDLISILPELKQETSGYLIDVGAGNGRNLKFVQRTLVLALDLSENLLRNYVANLSDQRVMGSATHLPIRKNVAEEVYSIAVVHHLENHQLRIRAIGELYRINSMGGATNITVWRKWRAQQKEMLFAKIRKQESIDELVNHNRPWKDPSGNTLGTRFYHYYTWKELIKQIQISGFLIDQRIIMGGKHNDANFLVKLLKN